MQLHILIQLLIHAHNVHMIEYIIQFLINVNVLIIYLILMALLVLDVDSTRYIIVHLINVKYVLMVLYIMRHRRLVLHVHCMHLYQVEIDVWDVLMGLCIIVVRIYVIDVELARLLLEI